MQTYCIAQGPLFCVFCGDLNRKEIQRRGDLCTHVADSTLLYSRSESEVAQSCLTLCNPMDCSLPGSPVCGIFQARVLEWGAISFSRGSSQPRDRTQVSHIADKLSIN